jgi:hypothetical protein
MYLFLHDTERIRSFIVTQRINVSFFQIKNNLLNYNNGKKVCAIVINIPYLTMVRRVNDGVLFVTLPAIGALALAGGTADAVVPQVTWGTVAARHALVTLLTQVGAEKLAALTPTRRAALVERHVHRALSTCTQGTRRFCFFSLQFLFPTHCSLSQKLF